MATGSDSRFSVLTPNINSTMQTETLQSWLDHETVQSMKESLGDSFAQLAHYHFTSPEDKDEQVAFNTILATLSDFHQVLTIAQKEERL